MTTSIGATAPALGARPAAAGDGRAAKERTTRRVPADLVTATFGLALGVGICWPFLGGRPLFLLDWVIGPKPPFPSAAMLGLNGGLTSGVPTAVLMTALVRALGDGVTWVPVLVLFPVAALGIGRLTGGGLAARLPAAALYCVNPWVFNRLYAGHIPLLFGYALLPFALRSALGAARRVTGSWSLRSLAPVLWWAGLTALSPHYAWIYGAVLLGAVLVARPWRRPQVIVWLACCTGLFVATSLYILLPHTATELPTTVGATSLRLYRTTGDPHLGLFVNVAGLYGFWRLGPGPQLPKSVVSGWPLLLLALLVVIGTGYVSALRRPGVAGEDGAPGSGSRRQLAVLLGLLGIAGYFLALGAQGPTGPAFTWAYDHVPFFAVMREPQKFLMLTALAYAVGLGWGVERLAATTAHGRRAGALALAGGLGVALPLGYTPTIFDGLAGQVAPSTIPAAYGRADQVMGPGPGRVLYLPWELYEEQPFTQGRVVATIGPSVFRRDVIAGDNVGGGPLQTQSTLARSHYLGEFVADGARLHHLGARLAPLGVAYVVLAKTAVWREYGFLEHQADLRPVLDTPTLEVWRNRAYGGLGARSGAVAPVRELSPVAYRVPAGRPGGAEIAAAYQQGWALDGVAGQPTPEGTTSFPLATGAGGVAVYTPWRFVRLGGLLSAAAVAVMALAVALATVRARGAGAGTDADERREQGGRRSHVQAASSTPGRGRES